MKHKVRMQVPVQKRGFLGFKKTVMQTRTVEVDGKTYRQMKKAEREKARREKNYSILEMLLLDDIFFND